MSERKKPDSEQGLFTASDLRYILEVNEKAIEIYLTVEKQNDQVLETLEHFKEVANKVENSLGLLKESGSNIEELLTDDNEHDHRAIIALLNDLTTEIESIKKEVLEVKSNETKLKEAVESVKHQLDKEISPKIVETDKNLFRLIIILGSTGAGILYTIIQNIFHK